MGTDPHHARNTKQCSPKAPDQRNAVTCLMSRGQDLHISFVLTKRSHFCFST